MRYFGVLFAILVAAFPAMARADQAADLLAKHEAFMGWQFGGSAVQSLDTTESVTDNASGKLLRTEELRSIGALFRRDTTSRQSAETFAEGFTGNVFWRSDANGFTVPVVGKNTKYMLAQGLVFTDAVMALPWSAGGTATFDGTTCTIVHVKQQNADPIDMCVDPATGAYKGVTIDPGGDDEETFTVLAYAQAAPGKRIISKYRYDGSTATHTITKMAVNTVTADLLHPPAQTATWDFANGNPFPIKLAPYRIIANATVNGVPGTFILDTGASDVLFSQAFAEKAHIKSTGTFDAGGIGGTLAVHAGRVDTLTIGGNTLRDLTVAYGGGALDASAPDGLLGFGVLGGADVTLDLAGQTMQIQPPNSLDFSSLKGLPAGIDLSGGVPELPMKLNGHIDIDAMIDSGNPEEVLFSPDLTSKYGLSMLVDDTLIGYFSSHRLSGGISGNYEVAECGHIDEIDLGPIRYQYVGACKSPSFGGRNALISLDFLRKFDKIYFSYPRAMMMFGKPTT